MKINSVFGISLIAYCTMASTPDASAAPHWNHEEQGAWGEIQDISETTAPLMYPFAECSLGMHQSPIDLAGVARTKKLDLLKVKYSEDAPDFFNSGHAVQVNASAGYKGGLSVGRDVYPLVQYHFHAPSEHVIGSNTFPGELHFVHVRADGRIAVLGVLLQEGAENPSLQAILDNVPGTPATHNPASGVKVNPMSLIPKDKVHFYTYAGSLTTPPCSEGVDWYVLAKPIEVSASQLARLQSLYDKNNRLTQAPNGRTVAGNVK